MKLPDFSPRISSRVFGDTPDGPATLWTLRNRRGLTAQITDYGGILTSLQVPDRRGESGDVVLGYDDLESYRENGRFFGALVGRYANRIAHGRFTLDGQTYQLATNGGEHHIHGGKRGFDKRLWKSQAVQKIGAAGREVGVQLRLFSADGEEGYPGNLMTRVTYWLGSENELRLEYEAVCDQTTIICLTNHSYFNLAGAGNGDILDHQLRIDASRFTPVDAGKIPTGELRHVEGTPFDFRTFSPIGARIEQDDEQLRFGGGYDHNFALGGAPNRLQRAAQVLEPTSGRAMELLTTEPGVQFYSCNAFEGGVRGKAGQTYGFRGAFCLETQHFPDSPNHSLFPSVELRADQTYRQTTIYRFSA